MRPAVAVGVAQVGVEVSEGGDARCSWLLPPAETSRRAMSNVAVGNMCTTKRVGALTSCSALALHPTQFRAASHERAFAHCAAKSLTGLYERGPESKSAAALRHYLNKLPIGTDFTT
jgi:hypothetical protein